MARRWRVVIPGVIVMHTACPQDEEPGEQDQGQDMQEPDKSGMRTHRHSLVPSRIAPPAKEQKVSVKKITTADAARCLGKSKQFVRIGLQRGLLPFGNAVPGVGGSYNYYINPAKFREYVGAEQFDAFFGLTA